MSKSLIILSQDRCRDKAIKNFPEQEEYFIPIEQELFVRSGDLIQEGQLLTRDVNHHILTHSPVSGIIKDIKNFNNKKYLIIQANHSVSRKYELQHLMYTKTEEIITRIYEAGLYTLDYNNVPIHIRFEKMLNNAKTVIVNAVEPEPFLVADVMLLQEKVKEILQAVFQIKKMLKAEKIIIAISKNKKLRSFLESHIFTNQIFVVEVPKKYSLFHDKVLIKELFDIEIPNTKIAEDFGMTVLTPTVCYALYEVLFYNKPVTERVISVDGAYSLEYGNFRVKTGTAISAFMRPFAAENSYVMFSGGPFLGVELEKEKSFTKSMHAVMIFEGKTNPIEEKCIYCSSCSEICPMRLEPNKLVDFLRHGEMDNAKKYSLDTCINCNLCSYVCPAFIPLGYEIAQAQKSEEII